MVFVICNNSRSAHLVKGQIADLGLNPNDRRISYITDAQHWEKMQGIQRGTPYYVDSWPDRSKRIADEIHAREFKQLHSLAELTNTLKEAP